MIGCYSKYRIYEAEQETMRQQAKQYELLYKFHQKLLVVEEEMEREKSFKN
jgi:hypothetical protein